MKEYKYLYQQMLKEETIIKAYKLLRKGKTKRREIQYIDSNFAEEVEKMRIMILNTKPIDVDNPELAYKPRKRTPKTIKEHGKVRKIYMPEIHEQWLHHIIVLVLEPIITATSYPYSCGSFPKRGAHYAKKKLRSWIRQGKNVRNYAKIDIRHFYDSIKADVLAKELRIRIKDEWFLFIIQRCLEGFEKGIPLGFYISQWLANYILEPLDYLITQKLGIKVMIRYMDDIVMMADNKKLLHYAIETIRKFLGRRFRLKLKRNYTVAKFEFIRKNGSITGRSIDFMGFIFHRNRVTIRKSIMLSTTRLAKRMYKRKQAGKPYYKRHLYAMVSYIGWYSCSNTYGCYLNYIKPYVNVGRIKKIISKIDRRLNNDRMETGTLHTAA